MQKLRHLSFRFDFPLLQKDIAGFRAAVAHAAGLEEDLFHNHDNARQGLHYRYPLVQFRSDRGRAAVVGLNAGADAVLAWLSKSNLQILYNAEDHPLRIDQMEVQEHSVRFWEQPRRYTLRQWLPLSQTRYANFREIQSLQARTAELDRLLAANILTFCRAVDWQLPQKFVANITDIHRTYPTGFLGNRLMAFDVEFACDFHLPFAIGLGKGVSHGFGVCKPIPAKKQPDEKFPNKTLGE
jgi:hypothetical protein